MNEWTVQNTTAVAVASIMLASKAHRDGVVELHKTNAEKQKEKCNIVRPYFNENKLPELCQLLTDAMAIFSHKVVCPTAQIKADRKRHEKAGWVTAMNKVSNNTLSLKWEEDHVEVAPFKERVQVDALDKAFDTIAAAGVPEHVLSEIIDRVFLSVTAEQARVKKVLDDAMAELEKEELEQLVNACKVNQVQVSKKSLKGIIAQLKRTGQPVHVANVKVALAFGGGNQ